MVDSGRVCDYLRSVDRNANPTGMAADTDQGHPGSLDQELIRTLRENFHKERFPCDGRIYQSIRFYQGATGGRRNQIAENFWWAVLQSEPGSRKADYLRALPQPLVDGFDALLPIKGLWADMSIGVLHKLRAMRCNEVVLLVSTQIRVVDGKILIRYVYLAHNLLLELHPARFL